jgi:hypothetical protein
MDSIRIFPRNRSGAIAPLFILISTALLIAAGLALDYARTLNERSEAQNVADLMALAAARELSLGRGEQAARAEATALFETHFGPGAERRFDFELGEKNGIRRVEVVITGQTRTTLMRAGTALLRFAGSDVRESVAWTVAAESAIDATQLEIAIVADVSNSMLGEKFTELKNALKQLVGALFPDGGTYTGRRVTLIPFADTVNFGNNARPWLLKTLTKSREFKGCLPEQKFRWYESLNMGAENNSGPGTFTLYVSPYNGTYPTCPPKGSEAVFMASDPKPLLSRIDNLKLGLGTGTYIATAWGWRALSPEWRGHFPGTGSYPLDHGPNNRKILILLTDGKPVVFTGSGHPNHAQALDYTNRVCNAIKSQAKIDMYVIGLAMGEDFQDARVAQVFQNCVSGNGKFFDTEAAGLSATINELVESINRVRLLN